MSVSRVFAAVGGVFGDRARNYLASMSIVAAVFLLHTQNSYVAKITASTLGFGGVVIRSGQVFELMFYLYALILLPYYYLDDGKCAARTFLAGVIGGQVNSDEWRQSAAKIAVKAIFVPYISIWFLQHAHYLITRPIPDWGPHLLPTGRPFFQYVLHVIFTVDCAPFLIGYLFEAKWMKNEFVSAETGAWGWFFCMICYPPFNGIHSGVTGWHSTSFPMLPSELATNIACYAILVAMGLYASASVSLGFKASNLTNRGIVRSGLYRVVRHPAYVCKNFAWWVGSIPAFLACRDAKQFCFVAIGVSTTTAIYAMRAMTEENHLLRSQNGYAEYMKMVRYRFIPGVF